MDRACYNMTTPCRQAVITAVIAVRHRRRPQALLAARARAVACLVAHAAGRQCRRADPIGAGVIGRSPLQFWTEAFRPSSLFIKPGTGSRRTFCASIDTNRGRESAMEHYYGVAQNGDQKWVVSVNGENVLVCTRKTDAVKAAKEATRLLTQPTAPIR